MKSWWSSQQMCRWQRERRSFPLLSREDSAEVPLQAMVFISGVLHASSSSTTGLAGSLDLETEGGQVIHVYWFRISYIIAEWTDCIHALPGGPPPTTPPPFPRQNK